MFVDESLIDVFVNIVFEFIGDKFNYGLIMGFLSGRNDLHITLFKIGACSSDVQIVYTIQEIISTPIPNPSSV